jgi:diguanylate cyclase
MLFKKKKLLADAPSVELDEMPAIEPGDRALNAVATLVRLYGKYAFDTDTAEAEQTEAQCADWATRISIGAARPRSSRPSPREAGLGPPIARVLERDWPGLIAFLQDRRRSESEYVVRSLTSFREAILCFADCLGKALGDERGSDALIAHRLDTLVRAIETRDVTRISNEAQGVVNIVRQSIVQRRRREVEQVWALGERLRELRQELSEARKKAEVDALTRLSNRAAFDEHVKHLASLGVLLGEAPWLILFDIDHFKAINDTYGHPAGDEVLRQVSQCLSRTFLRKHDLVCRYGGEEFAAVLLDTTEAQAEALAERALDSVRALTVNHGGREIRVTASLGLAALAAGENWSSWLGRADAALYRAKHRGRDQQAFASIRPSAAAHK